MPDTTPQAIAKTVQTFESKDGTGISPEMWWAYAFSRADLIPIWGTTQRDRILRDIYRSQYNGMVQGAFANLIKQVISTPFKVDGKKRANDYYQDVLVNAQFGDFGGGWRGFCSRLLLDFLTLDFGGVVEIIGGGNEMSAISGNVVGIAHLDSLRCAATGNPEFPIIYWSRKDNKLHRMHYTRVARFVDMPDGDEWAHGLGLSAMSRIIATAQQFMLMNRYSIQRLDDLPPAGLLLLSGIQPKAWEQMRKDYTADRNKDGADVWANVMVALGLDPAIEVKAELLNFSQLPEHFNLRDYTEILVNALALELGVDPQDIWPLSGQALGTGTQSVVLERKARGKMFGDILSMLERFINFNILPKDMEFAFEYQDDEADKTQAEIAQAQMNVANGFVTMMGSTTQARELAMRYLSDNVEQWRDVLTDPNGELIELSDDDPKEETTPAIPAPEEVTTDSASPANPDADSATVDSQAPAIGLRHLASGRKDIQATRLDFEADTADLFKATMEDDLARSRFGIVFRALIRKYGQKAYEDGLIAGGVEDPPSDDDLTTIAGLVAEQSAYVTGLGDAIFKEDSQIVDYDAKATLWFNKSIMPFNHAGIMSADKNGMYEFAGDDGVESCATCRRLKGQKHRFFEWTDKRLRPQEDTDNFECGGFRCEHRLVKSSGRARGSY